MKIVITTNSFEAVRDEICIWLRRAAQGERAFAQTALKKKRDIERAEYCASAIERLCESLESMDILRTDA